MSPLYGAPLASRNPDWPARLNCRLSTAANRRPGRRVGGFSSGGLWRPMPAPAPFVRISHRAPPRDRRPEGAHGRWAVKGSHDNPLHSLIHIARKCSFNRLSSTRLFVHGNFMPTRISCYIIVIRNLTRIKSDKRREAQGYYDRHSEKCVARSMNQGIE